MIGPIAGIDRLRGHAIEQSVEHHHRRRLQRLGQTGAIEFDGGIDITRRLLGPLTGRDARSNSRRAVTARPGVHLGRRARCGAVRSMSPG
jgi:hypothetical protein